MDTPSSTMSLEHKPKPRWIDNLRNLHVPIIRHLKKHTGVGLVCAVAYFDPGNWGVDLQAGSEFGYRLLFIVLLAGLFAIFLQVLAGRLGCVTGLDLASNCRLLLYDRPRYPLFWRWAVLYPLYVLAEVAIIATDLAELLGSAIALCLLFPKLELWHGVLITAFDVIFLLALKDPLGGRPVRAFELMIGALVIAVLICMCIIVARIEVNWARAFEGYLPSKYVIQDGGLYISVGILGATVMPHSLFIGSALATQNREFSDSSVLPEKIPGFSIETAPKIALSESIRALPRSCWNSICAAFRTPPPSEYATHARNFQEHESRPLSVVLAHVYHGTVDVAISLLGFAVVINSLILIMSSAVFYYGPGIDPTSEKEPASLFDAYDLIRDTIGQSAATLFAVALLASGQSSSIVATVAGQVVCEGFLQWRVSPVVRRLFTRLLAIIPSMIVAVSIGRKGIDSLLVISQVVLSIVLPFITFPLLYLTSSKAIMTAKGCEEEGDAQKEVSFSNHWTVMVIGWAIWIVIVAANVYVLVDLGRGGS